MLRPLRILLIVLGCVGLAWALSSDDQRRRLLVAFGLAATWEQAQATPFTLIGPGFSIELLPGLPPGPERFLWPTPPAAPPVAPAPSAGRAVAHGDDPCAVGRAAHPSQARPALPLYRYLDADGRTVFADQVPPGVDALPLARPGSGGVGGFSASYDYVGLTPPTGFQTQLEIDLAGVFRFLALGLELGNMEPVHLNLRVIDGERAFAAAAATANLSAQTVSGFYQFGSNQAVVRWQGDAATRAVARHEIAHLAVGNWLGRLPIWLNEGLAEFCERMLFQQSFATAEATPETLAELRRLAGNGSLPALRAFLAGDRTEWQRWGADLSYSYAWSIVHFLLQDPARARLLTDLLRQRAQQRCAVFDEARWLDGHYPGGLGGLESDWRQWLFNDEARAAFF